MALKKSIENNMGMACEYWRVMPNINVDFAAGTARGSLAVWVSQSARLADKQPAHPHDFMLPAVAQAVEGALVLEGNDFTAALATGDLRSAFYGKLKALEFFSDAEDVLEDV